MSFKETLQAELPNREVVVEFKKLNGDYRKMTCTLQESVVPTPVASDEEINRNRKPNENVCVVWDVNANGWRSFRWDSIISVS